MSKVTVKPLPLNKWHGKKDKDSFTRPKVIEVLYNRETGRYATGLTEQEAESFSKQMGVDLSDIFHPSQPHPYWSTKAASIKLENATMIFDTNKPAEAVKVKNMYASPYVANSMKEWEQGMWPEATHVIFDEDQEMEAKADRTALRKSCYAKLELMPLESQQDVIQIMANRSVRGKSQKYVEGEIGDLIEERPEEFLRVVELGKVEVSVRAKVLELIDKGILHKEAGAVYYMGDMIAADYEDAVRWFTNPENAKTKTVILEKLNKL